jgi:hypothetical protein
LSLSLAQRILRALALRQIEHECDALVTALFKCCPTNQHGHTATVLSSVLLFERLEPAATFLLFDPCVIPVAPVRRRQVRPPYAARNQVFAIVVHHAKKFVVGLKYATLEIPDQNSDDIGIDQAPDFRLALRDVAIQVGILQCDRGLRGEQLQDRDPGRREDARRQVVFEVEHADEFGLIEQRQAENGPGLALTDIGIDAKRGLGRGIV